MANSLKVASYNCSGLNCSAEYIGDLIIKHNFDLVFLQETWLLETTIDRLGTIHNDYDFHGISGVDSSCDILSGRPHGGVALLWHERLSSYVSRVKCKNNRICAVTYKPNEFDKFLFLCVYLPCDTMSMNVCQDAYTNVLSDIERLLVNDSYNKIILAGDWNTHFDRNNAQTQHLLEFITRNNLKVCWDNPNAVKDYTYMNFSLSHFSCIDHFIVSSNIFDSISSSSVLTDCANPSNHALIMMDIAIAFQSYLKPRTLSREPNAIPKPLWHKVNKYHIAHYKEKLAVILSNLPISTESLHCNDVMCTNLNHIQDINCCLQAGKYCFPHSIVKKTVSQLPLWKETIKPLRDSSLLWHHSIFFNVVIWIHLNIFVYYVCILGQRPILH